MKIYLVFENACNESECGCDWEDFDSAWTEKKDAEERASDVYCGRVQEVKVDEYKKLLQIKRKK